MAFDPVDELLKRIVKGGQWPPKIEREAWRDIRTWRAFAESDREELVKIADWPSDRDYRVDPLPERIRDAWADHLFGEELKIEHPDDADGELLEAIVGDEAPNDLTDDARSAERDYVVPEGEGWWRIYRDDEVADVPLVEWHSRASVAPFYVGKVLKAAAVISVLEGHGKSSAKNAIFRLFEIHTDGAVELVLFRGTKDRIGSTVPLDQHPETEELARTLGDGREQGAVWAHGLPMLMGRIPNRRGRNPRLGVSEFAGIKDFLLDLNEAASIGAENARLTAKKRIVVPPSAVRGREAGANVELVDDGEGGLVPRGGRAVWDASEDVLVADQADAELGRESQPFRVLEYSYDASALILHKRDLVESALTRVGLTPQWVGVRVEGEGQAISGTHLRLRLIPTDKAGRGKARPWDAALPRIVTLLQRVDALGEAEGGFGRKWKDPTVAPAITRANPLPTDEVEQATVEATLVSAGARSIRTSIKRQHPDWTDAQIDDELDAIREDRKAGGAIGGFA